MLKKVSMDVKNSSWNLYFLRVFYRVTQTDLVQQMQPGHVCPLGLQELTGYLIELELFDRFLLKTACYFLSVIESESMTCLCGNVF